MKNNNVASKKLWRIIKKPDGYYYEIRFNGMIVDYFKIPKDSQLNLEKEGLIK